MMLKTTRKNYHSQWRQKQPKSKEYQNKGGIFQRIEKFHSTGIKTRKMKDLEKLMFSEEESSTPAEFKVGSNHLILKNMMAHMSVKALQTARLVSKEWKKLANFELGRRKCCRWRLRECWWSKERVLTSSDDISWVECDLKWLNLEALTTFANLLGHQVKMLKLHLWHLYYKVSSWNMYWDFLSTGAFPNLEILRFHKCWTRSMVVFSNNNKISSPLKWTSNADVFLPSLQRIEGITLSSASLLPPQFLQAKGHLIKSAELDSWNSDSRSTALALHHMTQLAQAHLKLERLEIAENRTDPKFAKQMNVLLKSSRECLRTLKISLCWDPPFYFQLAHNQLYTKLSTLQFSMDRTCFDLKNQLERLNQEGVPNLKTLIIEVHPGITFDLPDPLCSSPRKRESGRSRGQLTSVVNLDIKYGYRAGSNRDLVPSNWFPWLSTLYPNIRNLTTANWKDTDEILRHVFLLWPKLTSLSIHIYYDLTNDVKPDFDPVFTGFSVEKCVELKKHPEKMEMTKGILTDRKWPNLNSLKELKRLDFTLTNSMCFSFCCPVSLISFFCAINLLPELKTTIRLYDLLHDLVRDMKLLEHLAPYARLELSDGTECTF